MECNHNNTEYIPPEPDTNVSEDFICLDCNQSLIHLIERI